MKPIKAAFVSIEGYELNDNEKRWIEHDNPLGIVLFVRNIKSPKQLVKLTKQIREVSGRSDFLIAVDHEGGRVSRLKPPYFRDYISQASIASLPINQAKKVAKLQAELIAHDLKMMGINCNFAPTLDVATPYITNALKNRCFSEDEKVVAGLGNIIFKTYMKNSVISCIKHFPGHSNADVDPHLHLPIITDFDERFFYPFEKIAPKAFMGMTAHIVLEQIDNLPITFSAKAIREIIRNRFEFKGILVSDALEMKALSGNLVEKTQAAISAGCNAVCYCKGDLDGVNEVLNNCGYLDDNSLRYMQKITKKIQTNSDIIDIKHKVCEYKALTKDATIYADDYDAVEILNKL